MASGRSCNVALPIRIHLVIGCMACRVPTGTLPACGVQRIDSISQMENNHGITPNRLVLGG